MFKKIIIFLLLLSYSAFSQFIVKAYVTTVQPMDQDFCITKSLEKHEDKYNCRKTKNSLISTAEINPITTVVALPDYFVQHIEKFDILNELDEKRSNYLPHAPPDVSALTNYMNHFLLGSIILMI